MPYKDREKVRAANRKSYQKYKTLKGRIRLKDLTPDELRAHKRALYYANTYNISPEKLLSMLVNQNNLCLVCLKPLAPIGSAWQDPLAPVVDHGHVTGENRALLHRKCNAALGSFEDNPKILRQAANYLETYGG